jgi:RNA polymerase sigma factor (sigma-70 family)
MGDALTARLPVRTFRSKRLLALAGDERLVEQIRRGNECAFEVAFERYGTGILGFCRHMLGSREEAEDAVQHTFAAAFNDLQRDDERQIALKPWLYTIARNRCLSLLRARREQTAVLEEIPTDGLHEQVESRAELRELLGDLRELPDEQRAALLLAEAADLSHAEVAGVLGCEVARVKALVFRARSGLIERREARETPCADIREQLANLQGSALRRRTLRRHLQDCAGCREYRDAVRTQRRELALVLPVAPSLALKSGVLAGAGVTAAGAGAGAGAAATGSVAAKALVAVALAGGGVAAVETAREPDRPPAREGAARAPVVTDAAKRPSAIVPAAAPAPAATPAVEAVPVKAEKRRGPKAGKGRRGRANGREMAAKPDKRRGPKPQVENVRRGPKPKAERVRPVTAKPKAEKRRGPAPKPSRARGAKPKPQKSGGANPGSAGSRGAGATVREQKAEAKPDRPRAVRPPPAARE